METINEISDFILGYIGGLISYAVTLLSRVDMMILTLVIIIISVVIFFFMLSEAFKVFPPDRQEPTQKENNYKQNPEVLTDLSFINDLPPTPEDISNLLKNPGEV